MVHGENRIPYWIDRRLTGLAGPEYHAIISFGLPFEPEDSQYGESRLMYLGRVINDKGVSVIWLPDDNERSLGTRGSRFGERIRTYFEKIGSAT